MLIRESEMDIGEIFCVFPFAEVKMVESLLVHNKIRNKMKM